MEREEDEVVFVCTECKSDQPEQYIMKNSFAAAGLPVPCRFCGGVSILTTRAERDRSLEISDRKRGMGPTRDSDD